VDKPFSWPSDIFYLFASPAFTYRVGRKADSTDSTVIDHMTMTIKWKFLFNLEGHQFEDTQLMHTFDLELQINYMSNLDQCIAVWFISLIPPR
jgi:hypothetical protein